MNHQVKIVTGLLVGAFLLLTGAAWGQDIKARMQARLADIVALKAAGTVGENNQGYLTVLKPGGSPKDLVEAENQDRRIIYDAIAKKQNTTADLVGRRRAMQIAEKADSSTWLQDAQGKWRQK